MQNPKKPECRTCGFTIEHGEVYCDEHNPNKTECEACGKYFDSDEDWILCEDCRE